MKTNFNTRKFKGGAYASAISVVVIAIVVVINLMFTKLNITVDLTADGKYSLTEETAGVQTMYIFYDEAKEYPWQLTTPEGTFEGGSDAVLEAISIFDSYSLLSTLEYNCDDFSTYGLEEPITTVEVRYTEEESSDVKTLLFEFGSVDPETDVSYVRINGSSYVYGMSEYYAEKISVFDAEELKYVPEDISEEEE